MSDKTKSVASDPAKPKVVIERTYRAEVEELWDLWTTKEGFESWWGPDSFRAHVHTIEAREGGKLHYDMVAVTPEMVEAMKQMGRPPSHESRGRFAEFRPYERLTLVHVVDFVPGVEPYDSTIVVDFFPSGEVVRMIMTLHPMHDEEFSTMQVMGFTSQLSKLDRRFGNS
jgi:uncharacterized protein YndB with AHSA1/START domain